MLQRTPVPLDLHLHARQFLAFTSIATEILYGGAAGGGKSFLMRAAAIIWCTEIAGLQVYLFRRVHEDLARNHMEGPKGFRALLAAWENAGLVSIIEDEIRFWNGSKIYLCHCQHEKNRFKYQGAEIHVLLIDELTHFTEVIYRFLRNRVRAVGLSIPQKYKGMFPRIISGANPGNIGHQWVKASFVDNADDLAVRQMGRSEGGMKRQFIRAKLEDNPSMLEDDPTYEARLEGIGTEAQVKAMRWGDWEVIEGAFFDNFAARRHVLRPVALPEQWMRFRAGDWGSAKPFSFGWYAVASDDWLHPDGVWVPRGGLVKYREWYGVKTSPDGMFQPDVGVKMTAEEVARGILAREEPGEKITYGVLDPAAFQVVSGPSIGETMARCGANFHEADNKRVPTHGAMGGWDQVRARLNGDQDGRAMLFFFSTCKHTIRTLPALQHDETRVEDVMTHSEDHCFAAGTLVETETGPVPIEMLPKVGLVHTNRGLQPYRSARMTRRNAKVITLRFDNGVEIVCTPDHRFLVDTDEWSYASELNGRSVLCSQLSSAKQYKSSMTFGITFAANTFNAKAFAFISKCGNTITGLFRMGATSITMMKTALTTKAATWNASPYPNIWADGTVKLQPITAWQPWTRQGQPQQHGTGLKRASVGIASTSQSTSLQSWLSVFRQSALSAARNIRCVQPRRSRASSAIKTARRVRCVAVEDSNARADVYCLTVPETGCFAIEGGILVSNCGDETRYACMSRPWIAPLPQARNDNLRDYEDDDDDHGDSWKIA